jgi:transcriptional regulator with XRE-family HTH domain
MTIGDRLMQERKRLGLSQAVFAKQVGVSLSSQKRYELGEREPDIGYLERAMRLGVDISFILSNVRREFDHLKFLGIDQFHGARIFDAIAKLLKFTKDDLLRIIQFVDKSMENDLYRNLQSDDSVFVSEEFFLIAVSELLSKKLQQNEFNDTLGEIDFITLSSILEKIELIQQKQNSYLPPHKKARAAAMLYRSFKVTGELDYKMIEDTVALSSEPIDTTKSSI